ncbi:MAG: L-aspartate oxidase [Candidatus Dormibacteria bacterium]
MAEDCDVLVVGSGIAGLCAALGAGGRGRIEVITKGALDEGCSRWAQGGIAAAVASDDSPDRHLTDTLAAGGGLCDERAVRILVEEGPARVRELIEWGVGFDTQDGVLLTGREAAHTRSRILHARGDATGLEIETALISRLRASPVSVLERRHVTRLLIEDGRCAGVEARDALTGTAHVIRAGAVILASGGAGRLWRHTTNPAPATGDGIALAYDAGADVASMEFVQFHPTALALPGAPRFLISEAVRGEGAQIVNAAGERFLFDSDPRGEMAGRDIVSQAIWAELQRSGAGCVYLDCTPLADRAALRFPTIHRTCLDHGIDITRDRIPIAPAAHYLVGGIRTDVDGATTLAGLYACGEVASSGVHGANRLASNSLLESVVFSRRAIRAALGSAISRRVAAEHPPPQADGAEGRMDEPPEDLREAMWWGAGVVRDGDGLRAALAITERILETARANSLTGTRLRHAVTCAGLVCRAALAREETRGCHLRSDFPDLSDNWSDLWVMNKVSGAHLDRHH